MSDWKGIDNKREKWSWMMAYCKKKNLPAAQHWAWEKARIAWEIKQTNEE